MKRRQGISLIEVLISITLIVILFGGIYLAYFSILDLITNTQNRAAAAVVLENQVEIVRNLPYNQVGTQGGVPSGTLLQSQTITSTIGVTFLLTTTVRNVDDRFDGTLGGTPNDTAPADYKLVDFQISCPSCTHFVPLRLTTTVAPKNLESASNNGSLFINVFNANGQSVSGANIHVVNASVTPAIDLTDITNTNGVLQLVDVPTSTQNYQMTVTKSGYSSEKTYPPGDPANPNPVKPHATVNAQTLTQTSFAIDRTSVLTVKTSNAICGAIPNQAFTLKGGKLIGTSPDVLKFSTSSLTDASGMSAITNLEWDTYTASYAGSGYNVVGTIPFSPFLLNPNVAKEFDFILAPALPSALLVTVNTLATSGPIFGSTVHLENGSYAGTSTTGHAFLTQTDWSGAQYNSVSGIDPESVPGSLVMVLQGGAYSTTTVAWLISNTFDVGSSTASYYTLGWTPTSQPPQTGAGSVKFQIATNNDQTTWNFVGPDGTAGTYYTTNGQALNSMHAGQRYLRYKVFLSTADQNTTPRVDDVKIEFNSVCVPPGQVLFNGLSAGTYTLTVSAPGYAPVTNTILVSAPSQQVTVSF